MRKVLPAVVKVTGPEAGAVQVHHMSQVGPWMGGDVAGVLSVRDIIRVWTEDGAQCELPQS